MSSIERRAYLRYKLAVPVSVETDDGAVIYTMTREISLGGMQIACDTNMLNSMLPEGIQTAPGDRVFLQATLNYSNHLGSISLRAHALGVLRLAESEFSVRCSFIDLDQMQQDQLQQLLNQ